MEFPTKCPVSAPILVFLTHLFASRWTNFASFWDPDNRPASPPLGWSLLMSVMHLVNERMCLPDAARWIISPSVRSCQLDRSIQTFWKNKPFFFKTKMSFFPPPFHFLIKEKRSFWLLNLPNALLMLLQRNSFNSFWICKWLLINFNEF